MLNKEEIVDLYQKMFEAMIHKDQQTLEELHDDSFELIHMTGMRQTKKEYIHAIMNGTLNYYDKKDDAIEVSTSGEDIILQGRSKVKASVFGGSIHTYALELNCVVKKMDGKWKIMRCMAHPY